LPGALDEIERLWAILGDVLRVMAAVNPLDGGKPTLMPSAREFVRVQKAVRETVEEALDSHCQLVLPGGEP